MHAVILAGGKGVRLRPYTTRLPKPLVPIGEEHTILEIVLSQLARCGFTRATLAIGHFGHLIRSYIGDGSQWGMEIDYTEPEEVPLGTIGPVLRILDQLPEQFLVMNGDVLTDIDYSDLMRQHREAGAQLTVATYERQVRIDFGVLTSQDDKVVGFREKPTIDYQVSMGVYACSRQALTGTRRACPSGSTSWCWTCWPGAPRRRVTPSTATGSISAAPTITTASTPNSALSGAACSGRPSACASW